MISAGHLMVLIDVLVLLTSHLSQIFLADDPRLLHLQNELVLQTYSFWQPGHCKDQSSCDSY